MNMEELKNLTKEEIEHKIDLSREKLRVLRFKLGANQLRETSMIREAKKSVARMMTWLHSLEK